MKKLAESTLRLLVLGVVLLTLLILLARFHWALELLSHFRLQLLAGIVPILFLTLILRRWKPSLIVALCLLPQLLALSWHYLPLTKDQRASGGPELKVMTFNVLSRNQNSAAVLELIEQEQPDLLFLQETNPRWGRELAILEEQYPYHFGSLEQGNFGLVLFSKLPFRSRQIIVDAQIKVPLLHAQLIWNGEPLTFVGTHPLIPLSKAGAQSRAATFSRIEELKHDSGFLIIAGDFNCSSYSPHFAKVRSGLRDSARGRGNVTTWHDFHPFFAIPIDHVLYRENLVCISRRTGPKCGSDHSPVTVTFAKTISE